MDFFVTHMYVSHTLSTLQQIAMSNMKTDLILKKDGGFLIMYGSNNHENTVSENEKNEYRETKKCV